MNEDIKLMTEFNSNKATLMRVDKRINLQDFSSYEEDLHGWFKILKIARRELLPKLPPEEYNEVEGMVVRLKQLDYLYQNNRTLDVAYDFEDLLDRFDILLRKRMDQRGMLLRDLDSAEEDEPEW